MHLTSINQWSPDWVNQILDWALATPGTMPTVAVSGLQGSGKSTLATQLVAHAGARGKPALALSIDDFYLTRRQRLDLARRVHPLLATRGPPGSHDIDLACRTLDALTALQPGQRVRLPRFDKLGDRRLPPSRWRTVRQQPALIVFEGWFLNVPAEPETALVEPVNVLERDQDPSGTWRRYCNHALAGYAPLWRRLDRLLFLSGPGFEVVPDWRWQQEQALQAADPSRRAMTRHQVERFVQFFERVSRQALRTLPDIADWTLELDRDRRPITSRPRVPDSQ